VGPTKVGPCRPAEASISFRHFLRASSFVEEMYAVGAMRPVGPGALGWAGLAPRTEPVPSPSVLLRVNLWKSPGVNPLQRAAALLTQQTCHPHSQRILRGRRHGIGPSLARPHYTERAYARAHAANCAI
jgi:hypothetical protein